MQGSEARMIHQDHEGEFPESVRDLPPSVPGLPNLLTPYYRRYPGCSPTPKPPIY